MAISGELRAIGRAVASVEDAALFKLDRVSAGDQLALIQDTLRRRRSSRRRRRWAGGFGLVVGVIGSMVLLWPRREVLDSEVSQPAAAGVAGITYSAPPGTRVPVHVSDDARIVLGPAGQLSAVNDHGARIGLARGTVCVGIARRPGNDWTMQGGPFVIHTAGADFRAAWDPVGEWLDVTVYRGSVHIRGDCLEGEVKVEEGLSKTLSCRPGRWTSSAPLSVRGRDDGIDGELARACN